ncbi:hypothetical protein RRG08_029212 [Elysia crispata]|uniref:Uncharacterized protein n=1 Tax=Elysia crispata TaxID=231223 RepID=A0AAE1DZS8_9GAST|nr:hypothetical protein RRG08_029212 [Elysia crispata]
MREKLKNRTNCINTGPEHFDGPQTHAPWFGCRIEHRVAAVILRAGQCPAQCKQADDKQVGVPPESTDNKNLTPTDLMLPLVFSTPPLPSSQTSIFTVLLSLLPQDFLSSKFFDVPFSISVRCGQGIVWLGHGAERKNSNNLCRVLSLSHRSTEGRIFLLDVATPSRTADTLSRPVETMTLPPGQSNHCSGHQTATRSANRARDYN